MHNKSSEAADSGDSLYTSFDVAASEANAISSPITIHENNVNQTLGWQAMIAKAFDDMEEPKSFRQAMSFNEKNQ